MPQAFGSISFAALALALLASAPAQVNAQSVAPRPLISSDVDNARLVRLTGNTRPEVTFENDRGPVDDSLPVEHLLLQLRHDPETDEALNQLMAEQQDKNSANYHRWLSSAEFGEKFGAAPADIEVVTRWLTSKGFEINLVYSGGMIIDFSGTAGQLRDAFQPNCTTSTCTACATSPTFATRKFPQRSRPPSSASPPCTTFFPAPCTNHVPTTRPPTALCSP